MGESNKSTRNLIGVLLVFLIGLVFWSMTNAMDNGEFEKQGLAAYQKEDYQTAIEYYDLGIQSAPGNSSLYNNRGLAHYRLKAHEKALSDFNKAIILKPDFATAYGNRGLVFFEDRQMEKAMDDFTKAIEYDPENADAYYHRGLCHNKSFSHIFYIKKPFPAETEEAFKKAMADFDKALELDSSFALAHAGKGNAYYRHGECAKAAEQFAKALEQEAVIASRWGDKSLGGVYASNGRNFAGLNQLEKAAANIEKAVQLDPKNTHAFDHGAWVYGNMKNYHKVVEFWGKVIDLIEKDPEFKDYSRGVGPAYKNRAKGYFLLGRYDKAEADYRKALASSSPDSHGYSDAAVYQYLGKICEKTGRAQEAREAFEKAIALYSAKAESRIGAVASRSLTDRGLCYFHLKEYDQAISDFEKVVAFNESSYPEKCAREYPKALKNLGLVHWELGDRDKANGYFKEAQKLFEERTEEHYAKELRYALKTGDVSGLLVLQKN